MRSFPGPLGKYVPVGAPRDVCPEAAAVLGLADARCCCSSSVCSFFRGDTHKVDVINFAQNKATKCLQNENLIDKESASLLWNFIVLLCRQNGVSFSLAPASVPLHPEELGGISFRAVLGEAGSPSRGSRRKSFPAVIWGSGIQSRVVWGKGRCGSTFLSAYQAVCGLPILLLAVSQAVLCAPGNRACTSEESCSGPRLMTSGSVLSPRQ